MADETIILKVEVDNSDLVSKLEKNKVAIVQLKEEQAKLNKAYKDGQITTKEYASETVRVEQLTKQHSKTYGELTHQLQGTKSWTDKLKDSFGKNSAVADKLSGGLVGTAQNMAGMTKAAMAFVATPIGAVIGALGIALGALTAYFKGSEEGQDRLSKVMSIGKVVFETVTQVVEKLGEIVFDTLEFMATGFKAVIEFFSPALGKMLDEALSAADQIASMQDAVDARENEMIVKRAETNKQVSELRRQAISVEGEQKRKLIEEAIKLEEELSKAEADQAAARLAAYQADLAASGAKTEEQKKQIAELTAAVINAEAQKNEATLKFQKELEALNQIDRETKETLRRADSEHFEQAKKEETEIVVRELDLQKTHLDTSLAAQQKMIDTALKAKMKASEKEQAAAEKDQKTQTKIAELEQQNRLMAISVGIGQAQALFEKDSVAHKFLGVARATIDTYTAANAAFAAAGGWPLGVIPAAITVATGLANVSKILGVGFSEGGYTGSGGKYEAKGVVHGNEYVIPSETVSALGTAHFDRYLPGYSDGGLVKNQATSQINSSMGMNMPEMFVSWAEGQAMGKKVYFKESMTER